MLAAAAFLLGSSGPMSAFAQDASTKDASTTTLPAIVVEDALKKPKRAAAKRPAPSR